MTFIVNLKKGACGLLLYIQPGAKTSEIVGRHGDALKVKIAASPVDGQANEAVIAFFSGFLDVKKSDLQIVAGQSSRKKTLAVHGATAEFLNLKLSQFE